MKEGGLNVTFNAEKGETVDVSRHLSCLSFPDTGSVPQALHFSRVFLSSPISTIFHKRGCHSRLCDLRNLGRVSSKLISKAKYDPSPKNHCPF